MPQTELDLTRLRSEIMDYLRDIGLPVFYGFGLLDDDDFTYWDTRTFPDWRQFLDVAKESGARLLVFSSETFSEEDLDEAFEKLSECEMDSEDRVPYVKKFEAMRRRVGHTTWLRLSFEHGGRWLAYELIAPWQEEFDSAMEELDVYLPFDDEEKEEGGSSRGFFSRN